MAATATRRVSFSTFTFFLDLTFQSSSQLKPEPFEVACISMHEKFTPYRGERPKRENRRQAAEHLPPRKKPGLTLGFLRTSSNP